MPGNEFEKQVQQKMNELKFVPSATVWHEVEKQINERKKRRLPFLWFILLGVSLGGAVWLYKINNPDKKLPVKLQPAGSIPAHTENAVIQENDTAAVVAAAVIKEKEAAVAATAPAGKSQTTVPVNEAAAGRLKAHINTRDRKAAAAGMASAAGEAMSGIRSERAAVTFAKRKNHPRAAAADHSLENSVKKNKFPSPRRSVFLEEPTVSGQLPAISGQLPDKENNLKENPVTGTGTIAGPPVQDVPAAATAFPPAAAPATAAVADSSRHADTAVNSLLTAGNKPAAKKKKNIQWGISAGIGGSNISQKIAGAVSDVFSSSTAYTLAADRNNFQSTPGNVSNGNFSPFNRAGTLKPGLSWSLNVFAGRSLGSRFKLMVGLGYSYYSMGLETGSKIDSNKALVQFSNGNTVSYTNRFHFIELPVTVQKQLGKTSRFSVNGGLAVSLLAASNALQYNAAKNIYFKDNSNINKLQLGLQAGFNYRLSQKALLVETGPQLSFGLSNIFKKETYGSMHLFFAGISTRVYFNRNKR